MKKTFANMSDQQWLDDFMETTDTFKSFVEVNKLPIRSEPQRVLSQFLSSNEDSKKGFLTRVQQYNNFLAIAKNENLPIMSNKQFVWRSLKEIGLRPPSDLTDIIDDSDCIEAYDSQGLQVFSSFEFFSAVSYTFEEVILTPWFDLFGREGGVEETIFKAAAKCYGGIKGPFDPEVPIHLVWEKNSEELRQSHLHMKIFCPIFDKSGKAFAQLSVSSLQAAGTRPLYLE